LPVIGTVDIAIAKHHSLNITKLVKAEQRMITGSFKVSIIGRAFLIPVSWTDRSVHILD